MKIRKRYSWNNKATNAERMMDKHCMWCGRKLRANYEGRKTHHVRVPIKKHQGHNVDSNGWCRDCETGANRDKLVVDDPGQIRSYGDYEDNAFCGLRCGYEYAMEQVSGRDRENP